MATSMRLAEHESEGDNEELFTEVVVDVQDPAAPIFQATRHGEGSHDTGRVITRLSEVIYRGAAAIDQDLFRVGAVEIHLGHVRPPSKRDGWQRDVGAAGVLDETARGEKRCRCEDLEPDPGRHQRKEDHLRTSRIAIA